MNYLPYILTLLLAQLDATINPLTGSPQTGQLVELNSAGATFNIDGQPRQISRQEFRNIDLPAVAAAGQRPIQVELLDGSVVRVQQFTVEKSRATLQLDSELSVQVPTDAIRRVLLQKLSDAEDFKRQWDELSGHELSSDILVFRREASGIVLDSIEGLLKDISASNVTLSYDDGDMNARRDKVIGVSYFHPAAIVNAKRAEPVCNVVDDGGSSWRAASLELKDGLLHWTTPTNVKVQMPIARIDQLDYAVGNLVYLSDLKTEAETWEPYIESRVPRELLASRYAPRRDASFDGGPLLVGGNAYAKGLALHSRSELVYRLRDDFRRFRAVAGIDDHVRDAEIAASVRLVITGDDKVLFEQEISVDSGAVDVDLDIAGVKRLKILVDFGDDLDVADYLNLCEARLTK